MPDQLFKLLGRRSAKVEQASSASLLYEAQANKDWWKNPITMVSDDYEVGIEIEVENVRKHGCVEYPMWTQHPDNSLRNSGSEYVTAPIKANRIPFVLNQFFATMGEGIHFSPRTSIHIHLNALDMTQYQVAGLLMAYGSMEKLLYRFVGGDRDKNNFCVPLMESTWEKLFKVLITEPFIPPNLTNYRYLGLNLDAIRKFGTLEFRHLGGTSNIEKIIKWINIIFCLKKYAMKNDKDVIQARICKLNSDSMYRDFFQDVFIYPVNSYFDTWNLKADMEIAVSRIKKLTVANLWKDELKKTFSAEKSLWYIRFQKKESKTKYLIGSRPQPRARRREPEDDDEGRRGEQVVFNQRAVRHVIRQAEVPPVQPAPIPPPLMQFEQGFVVNEQEINFINQLQGPGENR